MLKGRQAGTGYYLIDIRIVRRARAYPPFLMADSLLASGWTLSQTRDGVASALSDFAQGPLELRSHWDNGACIDARFEVKAETDVSADELATKLFEKVASHLGKGPFEGFNVPN